MLFTRDMLSILHIRMMTETHRFLVSDLRFWLMPV